MHLVGFTIEIYYDARSYKRQIYMYYSEKTGNTCVTTIISLPVVHLTRLSAQAI